MSEWELPKGCEMPSIERVGGGGFAWESGVYDASITMAYLNQTTSEAQWLNIILKNSEGKEMRENFCIRSGKAKGNKVYYVKDGKQIPLPGYASANSLCVAVTGKSLAECMKPADKGGTIEKKTINIWNVELKKEAPTERPVVMALVNKSVKVAVHQTIEDKTAKGTNGTYEPTGETRTTNECKFFGSVDSGKTAEEITKDEDATMFDRWAAKNTGTVIDKSSKDKPASAAAIMGSTPAENNAQGSLFN
jgi:hypothetical protein